MVVGKSSIALVTLASVGAGTRIFCQPAEPVLTLAIVPPSGLRQALHKCSCVRQVLGQPGCGRAAIEELHRVWTSEGGGEKRLTVMDAGSAGDLAWCIAAYSEGDATGDCTSLNIEV
jgi:hypothetical protein